MVLGSSAPESVHGNKKNTGKMENSVNISDRNVVCPVFGAHCCPGQLLRELGRPKI